MNDTKMCRGCLMDKPLSQFFKHGHARDGLMAVCASCWSSGRRSDDVYRRIRLERQRLRWNTEVRTNRGPELRPVPARFAAGIVSVLDQVRRIQR